MRHQASDSRHVPRNVAYPNQMHYLSLRSHQDVPKPEQCRSPALSGQLMAYAVATKTGSCTDRYMTSVRLCSGNFDDIPGGLCYLLLAWQPDVVY